MTAGQKMLFDLSIVDIQWENKGYSTCRIMTRLEELVGCKSILIENFFLCRLPLLYIDLRIPAVINGFFSSWGNPYFN